MTAGQASCLNGHRPDAELVLERWLETPSTDDELDDSTPLSDLDRLGQQLWEWLYPLQASEPEPEVDWSVDAAGWIERAEAWLLEHWGELKQDEAFQLEMQGDFIDPDRTSSGDWSLVVLLKVALSAHVDPENLLFNARRAAFYESKGWDVPGDEPYAEPGELEEFRLRLEYARATGGIHTLPTVQLEGKREPYRLTLAEAVGYYRAGEPDDAAKFVADYRRETGAVKQIKALMDRLYDMEKVGVGGKDAWAERQFKRSQLGGYRIRHEEIDRQMMLMVAQEWGLSIGDDSQTQRAGRGLFGALQPGEEQVPQLPGFTLAGRDCLLVGSGGAGKTVAALGVSYAVATGHRNLFDKEEGVERSQRGATLWIGTDGGDGAYGMVQKYSRMLSTPQAEEWGRRFKFWGASKETGETPWAFNVKGLHQLFCELERGHESGPYRLVVIDSLKAVMELGGLDFGIGPMGTCMRLIQAAAARFGVAVLWIHHLKPGAAKGDMGIDGAGGNSNITQIPFCVHALHKVQIKGFDHVVRWSAHKYRGEPSRAFNYILNRDKGLFELVTGALEEDATGELLLQLWLKRDGGCSTSELVESVDCAKKTVQNKLTLLGKEGKIHNSKRRWCITPLGLERLVLEMPELEGEVKEWLAEQKAK